MTLPGGTSVGPGLSLTKRYGGAERIRMPYQAPASPSHVPEPKDKAAEVPMSDSSPMPTFKPIRFKRTSYVAQYRIAGEMFYVEVKSRRTYIRHPRWSLMGAGKDLQAAERALFDEAAMVVRVYQQISARDLDEEAEKMLNFARRIA